MRIDGFEIVAGVPAVGGGLMPGVDVDLYSGKQWCDCRFYGLDGLTCSIFLRSGLEPLVLDIAAGSDDVLVRSDREPTLGMSDGLHY